MSLFSNKNSNEFFNVVEYSGYGGKHRAWRHISRNDVRKITSFDDSVIDSGGGSVGDNSFLVFKHTGKDDTSNMSGLVYNSNDIAVQSHLRAIKSGKIAFIKAHKRKRWRPW